MLRRSGRPRSGRREGLAVALGLAILAAGCAPTEAPIEELWRQQRSWHRLGDLWAHGVPLADRAMELELVRPAEFRALLLPLDSMAVVTLREPDGREREVRLEMPVPVRWRLEAGRHRIESRGATLVVRPRLSGELTPRRRSLVVVDTLRADFLDEEHAPEVFAALPDALRFERAFAPASWTLPSMASLFTGELPTTLRDPGDGSLIALPDEAETLAERLAEQGFVTVGVVANYTVNQENGYAQGFDLYWVSGATGEEGVPDAERIVRRARAALDWLADEPLFLYLHFMDPHDPYRNHETGEVWVAPPTGQEPGESELRAMRTAYDSEVRHWSRHAAPLLEELGEGEALVVTSDHGEEFLEHGGMRHGPTVWPEVTRVPLLVAGEVVEELRGVDELEVRSLVGLTGLLDGRPEVFLADRPVTMETFAHAPARWGWVDGDRQWVLFARQAPLPDLDAIGRWLESNHPREVCETLDARRCDSQDLPEAGVDRLSEQYRGFRRGAWLTGTGEEETVTVEGADGPVLCWLGCSDLVSTEAGSWRAIANGPTVLFAGAPEPERVRVLVDGQALPWSETASVVDDARWRLEPDMGRPAPRLEGIEETLDRLEALGYIER